MDDEAAAALAAFSFAALAALGFFLGGMTKEREGARMNESNDRMNEWPSERLLLCGVVSFAFGRVQELKRRRGKRGRERRERRAKRIKRNERKEPSQLQGKTKNTRH